MSQPPHIGSGLGAQTRIQPSSSTTARANGPSLAYYCTAKGAVTVAYEKGDAEWREVPLSTAGQTSNLPLTVTLEEDSNTPPRIVVEEPKAGRKAQLLDLNPQFANLNFAKVEAVTWKATDGHGAGGGLYLPPDYVPSKRYPLVIQTHGFNKQRFWIDGPGAVRLLLNPLRPMASSFCRSGNRMTPETAKDSEMR